MARGTAVALLDFDPTETYLGLDLRPIRQAVRVTFEYGVHFTRDLFAANNPLFFRLIRVPTTVLAQADSGVGVKNGVNAFGKKNFLGTFAPPFAVLNDFGFLDTLPDREWRGGLAEAVKVALLKDPDFFRYIEENA